MKNAAGAAALLIAVLMGFEARAGGIGVVDFQRAGAESADGKKAAAELSATFDKRGKALAEEDAAISKAEAAKESGVAARREKFNGAALAYRQEVAARDKQLSAPIEAKVQAAIEAVRKRRGLDVVLTLHGAVASGGVDITSDVIAAVDHPAPASAGPSWAGAIMGLAAAALIGVIATALLMGARARRREPSTA